MESQGNIRKEGTAIISNAGLRRSDAKTQVPGGEGSPGPRAGRINNGENALMRAGKTWRGNYN